MSRGNTPWEYEGPLAARFRMEGDNLVKQTVQPSRDSILEEVKRERRIADTDGIKDMGHGRYLGSIPMLDFIKLQESHPALFSPDVVERRKATIKFFNSPEGAPYRVQKA